VRQRYRVAGADRRAITKKQSFVRVRQRRSAAGAVAQSAGMFLEYCCGTAYSEARGRVAWSPDEPAKAQRTWPWTAPEFGRNFRRSQSHAAVIGSLGMAPQDTGSTQ